MKQLYILTVMLFSMQAMAMAQSTVTEPIERKHFLKFGVSGGIAFFEEKDLKKMNADLIQTLPFEVNTIDNFPPYPSYGGYILTSVGAGIFIGPSYQYYTSGSRLGAKDYSASYRFDQIISAHSLGLQAELRVLKMQDMGLFIENTFGVHLARWKMEEYFKMDEQVENSVYKFKAIKPFIYPCIKFSSPITANIGIAVKGGYSFDLFGKFKLESDPKIKSDKNVSFSGARLTVALEYQL